MRHSPNTPQKDKISTEFRARLSRLAPQQKIRAIVLLRMNSTGGSSKRHGSRAERQATIAAIRESAEQALVEIDPILKRYDGKRLSEVDALGSILVEATHAGIIALAASEPVKAILEEQPISLLRQLDPSQAQEASFST